MNDYDRWIADYVARHDGDVHRKCEEATLEMQEAFPELQRVRGHVWTVGRQLPHWWLKAQDGTIVDPTLAQFSFVPPVAEEYEAWNELDPEPIGKCMNCACLIFDHSPTPFCSRECHSEAAAELNAQLREGRCQDPSA